MSRGEWENQALLGPTGRSPDRIRPLRRAAGVPARALHRRTPLSTGASGRRRISRSHLWPARRSPVVPVGSGRRLWATEPRVGAEGFGIKSVGLGQSLVSVEVRLGEPSPVVPTGRQRAAPPCFHPHSTRGHVAPVHAGIRTVWVLPSVRRARGLEYNSAVTRTGRFVLS